MLAAFPPRGPDATGRLPAAEAPAGRRGPRKPPEQVSRVTIQVFITKEMKRGGVFLPAGCPEENPRCSFLPGACQGGGCAESLGPPCRCPGPEPEPAGPPAEPTLPWCDRTAAVGPKQFKQAGSLFRTSVFTSCCGAVIFGLSKNYLSFEMSLKCAELFLDHLVGRKHSMFFWVKNLRKL